MSFSHSLINNMINKAQDGPISFKLAAIILQNKKPIGPILYNNNNMSIRGKVCSSLHAEANVLLNHFKSSLTFSGGRWRVLRKKKLRKEI